MNPTGRFLLTAITAFGLVAAARSVAAQDLQLTGPGGQTRVLTAADIAAVPHVGLTVPVEGKTVAYEGPLLSSLLDKVGAPLGPALRGKAMADVVLVTARDGYVVALGLADVDARMRSDRVILADSADGKPLADGTGPYRLVVEGDLRPARSERMVVSIAVKSLAGGAP